MQSSDPVAGGGRLAEEEPDPRPGASSVMLSVYALLRREILRGRLPAGSRLHQADLARRYGVSITPIREALSALTSDGLVDSSPFSGSVVHVANLKEIDEVYELRAALTPLLVERSVARITPDHLAKARKIADAMSDPAFDGAWSDANRAFHQALDAACDQDQLLAVMGRLADLSLSYVAISVAKFTARQHQANDEHHELLRLYADGDTAGAVEISLQHIRATHQLVRSALIQSGPAGAARQSGRPGNE